MFDIGDKVITKNSKSVGYVIKKVVFKNKNLYKIFHVKTVPYSENFFEDELDLVSKGSLFEEKSLLEISHINGLLNKPSDDVYKIGSELICIESFDYFGRFVDTGDVGFTVTGITEDFYTIKNIDDDIIHVPSDSISSYFRVILN